MKKIMLIVAVLLMVVSVLPVSGQEWRKIPISSNEFLQLLNGSWKGKRVAVGWGTYHSELEINLSPSGINGILFNYEIPPAGIMKSHPFYEGTIDQNGEISIKLSATGYTGGWFHLALFFSDTNQVMLKGHLSAVSTQMYYTFYKSR
jgi:hypothetical protein